jgi:MFS family permease
MCEDSFLKIAGAFYVAYPAIVESRRKLQPQVILLGIAALLNDAASELIYPLLPVFLSTTLGASAIAIGLIEGVADGLSSILKYFSGAWSDRAKGRKPLVVSGYALAAASRLLIAAATLWPMVLLARLIDRTGKGIRSAPRDAMISDVTAPEDRGRAYGFHRALDHTGAIVGPLLAVLLLQGFGFSLRATFLFAVIPGAIGVAMLMFLLQENRNPEAKQHAPAHPRRHPTSILRRSPFRTAIIAIALFSLANSSDAFLLLQAHAAGVSTAMLPLLWAAHHVIKSLFSTRAGALSDRVDRRWLLIAGWTAYAAIYTLFPFAKTLWSFVILFVLYAIPFTLTEGAERAWIADLVPAAERGRSFGVYYLATGLCVLIGTAIFGVLYQRVSPLAAFLTGAMLALGAVMVLLAQRNAQTSAAG